MRNTPELIAVHKRVNRLAAQIWAIDIACACRRLVPMHLRYKYNDLLYELEVAMNERRKLNSERRK